MFTEQVFIMILYASESVVYMLHTVYARIMFEEYTLVIPGAECGKQKGLESKVLRQMSSVNSFKVILIELLAWHL